MRLRIDHEGRFLVAWALVLAALPGAKPSSIAMAQIAPSDTHPTVSVPPATSSAGESAALSWTTFARSGRKVAVSPMLVKQVVGKVVLRAYGRTWTEPVAAFGSALIDVPNVRVPTVFAITSADNPKTILGELVAYPDRDVQWDAKITLYSCRAPVWFSQWASAIGLPVQQVLARDLASAKLSPSDEKGRSLLILGRSAAGRNLPDAAKLAKDKKVNMLVLDANWFGDAAGPVSVAPPQMLGALAEIAKQRWPKPLKFASRRRPWGGIANRWAWIADDTGLPLVEELACYAGFWGARFTSSYVAWRDQLGRREQADELLLSLLKAAGGALGSRPSTLVEILYPPATDIEATSRPILKAVDVKPRALAEWPGKVYIVDFRARKSLPQELLMQLKRTQMLDDEMDVRKIPPLLLLGDDKILDEWEWLKLDRAKKTVKRASVVWLPDDELPPSKDNQIRLMLKLTELGVPIVPPEHKEKQK